MRRNLVVGLAALTLSLTLFAAGDVEDSVTKSRWKSTFHSNGQGFSINAAIKLNGSTGTYDTQNNQTGNLTNVSYKLEGDTVLIRGQWALNGQTGKFSFRVSANGDKFDGDWTNQNNGDSGWWRGTNVPPIPSFGDQTITPPTDGPHSEKEFLNRHAWAVIHALVAFDGNCKTQLFANGETTQANGRYRFYVNQKRGAQSQTIDTEANAKLNPFDAALDVIPRLKAAGSPCQFLTKEQVEKASVQTTESAILDATQNLGKLNDAVTSGGDAGIYHGKINGPAMVITENEVVLNDPMDVTKQKELINQSNQGLQEDSKTNGSTQLETFDQTFGLKDFLELRFNGGATRPTSSLAYYAFFETELLFLKKPQKLFFSWAKSTGDVELHQVQLQAEVRMLTAQGYQKVKSIDEKKATTYELPEEKFFENRVLYRYPPECVVTPVGPACIEGSVVASAGVKPYGVTFDPNNFRRFLAYVRPYAHIDLDVFGGLEYAVAHAGIRGQVSIINAIIAVLGGALDEGEAKYCSRIEVEKASVLDGRILLDLQGPKLPIDQVDEVADKAKQYCEYAQQNLCPIVDFAENVQAGLIQANETLKNTAGDVADAVKGVGGQVADAGKGAIEKVTKVVSVPSPPKKIKLPAVSFSLAGDKFSNAYQNLRQTDCGTLRDKIVQGSSLRYVKELYHWDGVTVKRHHKWFERCTAVQ